MRPTPLKSITLFIILILTIMPIFSANSDMNPEYEVKIGDKKSYFVKLVISSTEKQEFRRGFRDIFGEMHSFNERKGTKYTFTIIHVNNTSVIADILVDNLLIEQVVVVVNSRSSIWLLSASNIQSYLEKIGQNGENSP